MSRERPSLTRGRKAILAFLVLFAVCHWVFFLVVFFGFHDVFTITNLRYIDIPPQELELLLYNMNRYESLDLATRGVGLVSFGVYSFGIHSIAYTPCEPDGHPLLPLSKKANSVITWVPILLFIALFFYVTYGMDRCFLWLEMTPYMVYSAEFLALVAFGFRTLRKEQAAQ